MHPVLFEIELFGKTIPLYGYGVMIMVGAIIAYLYISINAKRELDIPAENIQALARIIIITAFIGGKFFYYLEDPAFYFREPSNMLVNFRTGFVFYGSLLFAVPSVLWYLRKKKMPVLPLLDIIAVGGVLLHASGRLGCFLAGCCYGHPTEGPLSITFTNQLSKAPLHEALHPTQLYSFTLLISILIILLMFKRHQRFKGQLFLVYIGLYAFGRAIIEIFRGDLRRGFIVEDILSHSQFISLILILLTIGFYIRISRKSDAENLNPPSS